MLARVLATEGIYYPEVEEMTDCSSYVILMTDIDDPRWTLRNQKIHEDIQIFHDCRTDRDKCGCNGYVGGYDLAIGNCPHCSQPVPKDLLSVWLVANSNTKSGLYYALTLDNFFTVDE